MAVSVDIFNPQISVIAHGLEGKTIMIYGNNNVGKTAQSVRAEKPYVLACESGLNGQSGVAYNRINNWYDFKTVVKQFTSKATIDQAKAMYKTIIIDEVYASAMFCQDFICQSYGNGAIDLGDDTGNSKLNLYRLYEKEYWREVNKLVNSGYTVIFIAHESIEDGYAFPKGDKKRCLAPIIDNCDIVAYIRSNGVDENGKELLSSAYFVQTKEFFARSRYPYIVPMIQEFTIENFIGAINDAIAKQAEVEGITTVDYAQQVAQNESVVRSYDELMEEMQVLGEKILQIGSYEDLVAITERTLGQGKKANDLKKGQEQIIQVLIDEMKDYIANAGT